VYSNFPGANAEAAALYPATVTRGGGVAVVVDVVAPSTGFDLEDDATIADIATMYFLDVANKSS
jgi:hypothetical protein